MKKIIEILSFKFFDFIYKQQKIKHQKRMQKFNKKILSAKVGDEKFHSAIGATLSIKSANEEKSKINQEKIEKIVEKYIDAPEKFFDYIKGAGTKVYKIKKADKILSLINEQEGFILPKKGFKAMYLNLILNKKISFNTDEIFVFRSLNFNTYALIYQFYNWYCYKMKLSGYEIETQEKFKNVFKICETNEINELNFDEILNLKNAIKRDIEAINFVKKMTQKFEMAKKSLEKIKQGKSIRV